MENFKYVVYYSLPKERGRRKAVIEAPDSNAARNMADHMYGNVVTVVRDLSSEPQQSNNYSAGGAVSDKMTSLGRDLARQHLGVIGDSLPDRAILIMVFLALGAPVVGLWMWFPVYKAYAIAPSLGTPPVTICVGVGLVAFCLGWLVLYICPIILLRIVGLGVYAGWFIFYVSGWSFNTDILQSVTVRIITVNSDAANLQKAELLAAALAGFCVIGGLGKAVKGD